MIRVKGDPIERPRVTEILRKTVIEIQATVTENPRRKRGRPRKQNALTPAEKQKAYRDRRRVAHA